MYHKGHSGGAEYKMYDDNDMLANLLVVGVGGAGGNAVNRMIESGVDGVEYVAVNTDVMALEQNKAPSKIVIGKRVTRGLGAGGRPAVGYDAAKENKDEIAQMIEGADMVFITAGMGGGTGTGAAPLIADISKSKGALTVGVVTKPFAFEGRKRARFAKEGINSIKDIVDTLIVIPNENLLSVSDKNTSLNDAFKMADEVLMQGVSGISNLISSTGLINVDFADVRTVMMDKGIAHMGIGRAETVMDAMMDAINSPLLETTINGAGFVLVNVAGDENLNLQDVNNAMIPVHEAVDPDAEIIFGTSLNNDLKGEVVVTLVVTGLNENNRVSAEDRSYPMYENYHTNETEPAPVTDNVFRKEPQPETTEPETGTYKTNPERFKNSEINIPDFLRHRR